MGRRSTKFRRRELLVKLAIEPTPPTVPIYRVLAIVLATLLAATVAYIWI